SPLPIAIASLGWGSIAGAIAAAVAAGIIGLTMAPVGGVVFAIAAVAPMAWYAHLVGLAREGADGSVEWYPLWRVFTAMVLITPASLIACGVLLGLSIDDIAANLAETLVAIGVQDADGQTPDPDELLVAMRVYVRLMPITLTMLWLSLLVFNLWLAGRIVRKSDRLRRPWEVLPEAPGLPAMLLAVLAVAVVLAFGDGSLALAAGAVAGGVGMGFALQGFATLHVLTRGNPARGLLLGTLYVATFVFSLPLLPVAAIGAADSAFGLRRRRTGGA
ncbi:MAG TPA: hypothetical protein VMP03_10770, partial [Methylomirabilota bacterium]|nr:hypothetical protein [Methylomirabilota bacterium]